MPPDQPSPDATGEPWKRCPSTHCERRGECTSPSDCIVKSKQGTEDVCQCPKCGRLHRDLKAGRPPMAIAGVEEYARIIYEADPHYESGEYVDGFPVSPGGNLTWEQAKAHDAEFGDDPRMLQITAFAYKAARAIAKPTAPVVAAEGQGFSVIRKGAQ